MVHYLWYTVLSTLHHHTAAEDTAEIGALDGVHQSACVDRAYTVLLPVSGIRIILSRFRILKKEINIAVLDTLKQCQQVIDGQRRGLAATATIRMVGCTVLIRTFLDTFILQLIVGRLTGRKFIIFCNSDFRRDGIIISTVVGDIQATIAVHESQVTIAVQTAHTSCAQGNQITMIDIVYRCRSITEHRSGVSIDG